MPPTPPLVRICKLAGTKAWSAASTAEDQRWETSKIWSYLGVATAAIGWLLLALGIAGFAVACILQRHGRSTVGTPSLWISSVIWLGVLAVVFALFGLIPAFEPEMEHLHWSVSALIAGLLAIVTCRLGWVIGRYVIQQGRLAAGERTGQISSGPIGAGHRRLAVVPRSADGCGR